MPNSTISLPDARKPPLVNQPGSMVIGLRLVGTTTEYALDPAGIWWLVGSSPRADICVRGDKFMSSSHATLHRKDQHLVIADRSKNGTFVCGAPCTTGYVHPGATIQMGGSLFVAFSQETRHLLLAQERLVGTSAAFAAARAQALKLAATRRHLLLCGETGVGKRTFAETIHQASPSAAGPFVVVDGGAVARGAAGELAAAMRAASGGSLLITGVDTAGGAFGARLAQAMAEVDRRGEPFVRVLLTTTDPAVLTSTDWRALREQAVAIPVPPLRERVLDVAALVALFFREVCYGPPLSYDATEAAALAGLDWPGNVAQLRLAVRTALADDSHGVSLASLFPSPDAMRSALRVAITGALPQVPSRRQASKALGLPWSTFGKLCRELEIA